jgi:hypothetical protein
MSFPTFIYLFIKTLKLLRHIIFLKVSLLSLSLCLNIIRDPSKKNLSLKAKEARIALFIKYLLSNK